ncbi:hypothetical protein K1T71_010052 [Dendrolimus kikuchii]|uniref:Uncharacterized protein n=1 Tax=Dendrolimus kikuchii TaxID=765133 RepID=A0ACC1CQR0_9NEOP|nr:hypothetical protein K1T71_010052 [Dendrolimus kikuchii]
MEMSKKVYNLRSLPGGRRGASGADAGCHSMRTIGDEGLSRRAPVDKTTTADRHELNRRTRVVETTADFLSDDTTSLFSSIPSTCPSYGTRKSSTVSTISIPDSVVQDVNFDTELAPTSGARKKWTQEMNKFILRTYFLLTALETDTKNYLESLHIKFTEKYPNMQVSRQRVGDQRRAIIRNKLLPQNTIDQIFNEVKQELTQLQAVVQNHTQPETHSQTHVSNQTTQNIIDTRMKWTNQHNEAIMRSYYRTTNLGTNKTAYRKLMHTDLTQSYPPLANLSEQRIADQRRAIVNNQYISKERLTIIQQEIAKELEISNNTLINTYPSFNETPTLNNNISQNTEHDINRIHTTSELILSGRHSKIDETFQEAFEYYTYTDPTSRAYIPKQKTSKNLAKIIDYINRITLKENITSDTDFFKFQTIIYCAAWTAAKVNGTRITLQTRTDIQRKKKDYKPKWQIRLEMKLKDIRKKIGRLTQFIQGNRSRNITKHSERIMEQYKAHTLHEEPNTQAAHVLDTLKQKLSVVTGRLQRYKDCSLRKQQNTQFNLNEKLFYRNIRNTTTNTQENCFNSDVHDSITPEALKNFWAGIWEKPIQHNIEAEQISTDTFNNLKTMTYEFISTDILQKVIRYLHNWKSPGSDNIHSFWYKKFTTTHSNLHKYINSFIQDPTSIPSYLTMGTTYMIPKDPKDLSDPSKYRPITCLQTLYKIMTSCISEIIYNHIDTNQILAEQQKGCRKFSQGCKEQLTIDSVILKQVHKTKSNLFTMYIDYKKAYDSVPHSWLVKVLEIYKIHPTIITFLKTIMTKWSTVLRVSTIKETIETDPIQIQRGIFQGDALSPLWFCLALNPLSQLLNVTSHGYPLCLEKDRQTDIRESKLNHLLYMDDIKLYAATENELKDLADIVDKFSIDIKMEFGIDKCKINSVKNGQNYSHHYTTTTGDNIIPLCEWDVYKYLGYNQSLLIHHKDTKQKLTQQFQHRLNMILKTQLHSRNTVKAINTFVIPLLTYSFGIINWNKTEIKNLQRKINTTMTKFRKNHPRSCLQRLTLPRKEGGRGLIDILNLHNKQITTLRKYFFAKAQSSIIHKLIVQTDRKLTPLNLQNAAEQTNEKLTDDRTKITEWTQKSLHGRHRQDLCLEHVDKEASNAWLTRGELFPETEGFMIAIQDQVIETKNYRKHIIKNLAADYCRKCNSSPETIQHITGACKSIVQTDYKHRHDQVTNIIHQKLAHKYNLINTITPYYKYKPETVLENSTTKLYFDRAILTDRTIHYNRPDITLINKTTKTGYLIDIAIPNTHNIQTTISEKLTKYTELKDEITRLWHLQNVTIIPVVLSSTGVIPKLIHQSLKALDLPANSYHLMQKATILNTCRIVRKFLQGDTNEPTYNYTNISNQVAITTS